MKQNVKEAIKEQGIDIPADISDPQEREYFELLEKAIQIAVDREFPLICLIASDAGMGLSAMMGSKKALVFCLKILLRKEPDMLGLIMCAVAEHMMSENARDKKMAELAEGLTPTGN